MDDIYLNVDIKKATTNDLNVDVDVIALGALKNVAFLSTRLNLNGQPINASAHKGSSYHNRTNQMSHFFTN